MEPGGETYPDIWECNVTETICMQKCYNESTNEDWCALHVGEYADLPVHEPYVIIANNLPNNWPHTCAIRGSSYMCVADRRRMRGLKFLDEPLPLPTSSMRPPNTQEQLDKSRIIVKEKLRVVLEKKAELAKIALKSIVDVVADATVGVIEEAVGLKPVIDEKLNK